MTSKYSTEQKTLRAKLDHLIKWTRDLKSHLMKQSCKILQTRTNETIQRELINRIHDHLDEYKHKFDREFGRIHDICDALNTIERENRNGSIRDEILEALRRSPTYSSLERHMIDKRTPRIRMKARERIHPGQKQTVRTSLSTDAIKRKASQPITLQVLDTTSSLGTKRRTHIESFKRSRSFTNIEHHETQLGMDYIEEDDNDLAWKPFGSKKSISTTSLTSANNEQSNDEQTAPKTPIENDKDQSSDEEFDVAWQRRAKKQAQKEAAAAQPPPPSASAELPAKRSVRFSLSVNESNDLIELDLDENTQDAPEQNSNDKQTSDDINPDNEDETTRTSMPQESSTGNDTNQIILDSSSSSSDDNDDIITINDDDDGTEKKPSTITRKQSLWTTSEIEITTGNSQSQSLHNPYRIGIADPSLRSVFLPAPSNSPSITSINKKSTNGQRKTTSNKRLTNTK